MGRWGTRNRLASGIGRKGARPWKVERGRKAAQTLGSLFPGRYGRLGPILAVDSPNPCARIGEQAYKAKIEVAVPAWPAGGRRAALAPQGRRLAKTTRRHPLSPRATPTIHRRGRSAGLCHPRLTPSNKRATACLSAGLFGCGQRPRPSIMWHLRPERTILNAWH
jgi:hypothetical protein